MVPFWTVVSVNAEAVSNVVPFSGVPEVATGELVPR
jgi:hypothetical protein